MTHIDKKICAECIKGKRYKEDDRVLVTGATYYKSVNGIIYLTLIVVVNGEYIETDTQCKMDACPYKFEHEIIGQKEIC